MKYQDDQVLGAQYFDENGNGRSKPVEALSEPRNGLPALYQFFIKNMNYPKDARKAKAEGKVYLRFTVNEQGYVEDYGVINPEDVHPSLVAEAYRLLLNSAHQWKPATIDGKPTKSSLTLPMVFQY